MNALIEMTKDSGQVISVSVPFEKIAEASMICYKGLFYEYKPSKAFTSLVQFQQCNAPVWIEEEQLL